MKYVLLSILLSLVQRHVYGGNTLRFEQNVVKRQAEYSACITMYSTLSTDELNCLPNYNFSNPLAGLENGLLSPSDLTGVCRSTFCMNVASSLLETCKVIFQSYLPEDYSDISAKSLIYLLCANDLSGVPCYTQLPLNTDVLTSCQNVLGGDICNQDCRNELAKYNTTCCFATLLSLQPDTGSEQLSQLWSICDLSSNPTLCDLHMPVITEPVTPSSDSAEHSGKDESSGSNAGYIVAGMGGFLILVVIVTVIIVAIVTIKRRSRSRFSMNSGDVVRMPLATDDPDD